MLDERFSNEKKALGERIKAIRKSKGLSQLDLSLIIGTDRGEISRIENGKANIEFLTIVRLALALEVEVVELFWTGVVQ